MAPLGRWGSKTAAQKFHTASVYPLEWNPVYVFFLMTAQKSCTGDKEGIMSQKSEESILPDLPEPPQGDGDSGGDTSAPPPVLPGPSASQGQAKPRGGLRGLSRREAVVGLVGVAGLVIGGGDLALHLWQLLHPSSGPRPGDPSLRKEASNLDFAAGTQIWFLAGDTPQDYAYGIDPTLTLNGKASAYLKARVAQPAGFGTLMQAFQGIEYRGTRLRMSGSVKAQVVEQWAGLWMRVDGDGGKVLSFDNMQNRQIQGTRDWKQYEVVLDVPAESVGIYFGILLAGKGQVWLSNVQFEVVGTDVPTTSS